MRLFVTFQKLWTIYYLRQNQILHKKFNFSSYANIPRNVGLQIALIAFLAYTKNQRNFVQMFVLVSGSTDISPQIWLLWRKTRHYTFAKHFTR